MNILEEPPIATNIHSFLGPEWHNYYKTENMHTVETKMKLFFFDDMWFRYEIDFYMYPKEISARYKSGLICLMPDNTRMLFHVEKCYADRDMYLLYHPCEYTCLTSIIDESTGLFFSLSLSDPRRNIMNYRGLLIDLSSEFTMESLIEHATQDETDPILFFDENNALMGVMIDLSYDGGNFYCCGYINSPIIKKDEKYKTKKIYMIKEFRDLYYQELIDDGETHYITDKKNIAIYHSWACTIFNNRYIQIDHIPDNSLDH